ncbi:MAG: SPOR domain-containing protein [Flavobacteriales bacterium]|nr:SPOR domain-containing protein [Flavobacteriales bacterium]
MKKFYTLFALFLIVQSIFGEGIELENKILKNDKNKYHIVTHISGQDNPGILRLTFTIPDEYTFKLFNDPNLLIENRGNTVKFYTNFDVGNEIDINYQLIKDNEDESEAIIPIHLEYTVDGEMINIDKDIVLAQHTFIEDKTMDSLTTHFERISKQYENRDELALNKIKELSPSKSESQDEEETSVAVGYSSNAKKGLSAESKTYSVQILSLQFFNETRFKEFLSSYQLKAADTYKKEINGMVKIYIGKFSSYEEAKAEKDKLIKQHNLSDSFIVSY